MPLTPAPSAVQAMSRPSVSRREAVGQPVLCAGSARKCNLAPEESGRRTSSCLKAESILGEPDVPVAGTVRDRLEPANQRRLIPDGGMRVTLLGP